MVKKGHRENLILNRTVLCSQYLHRQLDARHHLDHNLLALAQPDGAGNVYIDHTHLCRVVMPY